MSSSFGRIALSSELKNVWHHKFKTCMKYLMPTHICPYVHFLAEFKSSVKIFVGELESSSSKFNIRIGIAGERFGSICFTVYGTDVFIRLLLNVTLSKITHVYE